MKVLISCSLLLVALLSACSKEREPTAQLAPDLSAKLDQMLDARHSAENLAGLSVSVLKDGVPLYRHHWGGSSNATVYNVASVTKPFTSIAILKLRDTGKLALSDPLSKFLPDVPKGWDGITIKHLLSHTSGIPDYTKFANFRDEYGKDFTLDEVLKKVYGYALEFSPGTRFEYSNTGFVLLGHVIAKVSEVSYPDYMQSEVFGPLGMKNAFIATVGAPPKGVAIGQELSGTDLRPAPYTSPNWSFSAGAMMASLDDFCAFDKAIAEGKILSETSMKEAWTPVVEVEGKPYKYGLGWMVTHVQGKEMVLHFGDKPGYSACYAHFPGSKLSIVVLANRTEANSFGIAQKVYEVVKSLN